MLVYGDCQEPAEPNKVASEINRRLDAVEATPRGPGRHALLVAAFIETAKLLQGLADASFAKDGCDRLSTSSDRLGLFLHALGKAVCNSWDNAEGRKLPRLRRARSWPGKVELRVPEGFAFYAVYPEAYIDAARRLALRAPAKVIGIRSIGTALGAIVAAALGAGPAVTLRPFGGPFERQVATDGALERELLDREFHYVIVDEGPGQSGSSFGAVADWLTEHQVPPQRIALLPSHAGEPGPEASSKRRCWWRTVHREVGDFGRSWPIRIERWCAPPLGRLDEPPLDVSAGEWRRLIYEREEEWPPVIPAFERRKFLLRARGGRFLAKFAGLGRTGEDKLAIARTLHGEGFVPEPQSLANGFLIERWREDGAPLESDDVPLEEIARYIAGRAKLLPAAKESGAGAEQLLLMTRRNISIEFDQLRTRALQPWERRAASLQARMSRVRTDNKLDRHEWLRSNAGSLIKTDALDHHQAHDLIGCQDIAWDVAGAIVEFDVDQDGSDELLDRMDCAAAKPIDRELLDFYLLAYPAFRLGQARLGAAMTGEPAEKLRINRAADSYASRLQRLL
ncbi:MAG: hypothetical protein ACJ8F4_04095 [Sphingomonas sp.]